MNLSHPLVDNRFDGHTFQKFAVIDGGDRSEHVSGDGAETCFVFLIDGIVVERSEWTQRREAAIAADLAQAQSRG